MWHFVRVCDINTRELVWVNSDNTFAGDAVTISQHGRVANPHTSYNTDTPVFEEYYGG